MNTPINDSPSYALLNRQLEALLDTRDWLTNSAQLCALMFQQVPALNWEIGRAHV